MQEMVTGVIVIVVAVTIATVIEAAITGLEVTGIAVITYGTTVETMTGIIGIIDIEVTAALFSVTTDSMDIRILITRIATLHGLSCGNPPPR